MKYLLLIGVLLLSLPFWLPNFLGGQTSYHFVITDSMKGSVDPGSFVVIRDSDNYDIGDVVGFRQEIDEDHSVIILHRIIEKRANGKYMIKGDATVSIQKVDREQITGKMVLGIPYLGFIPGAFGRFPQLLGVSVVAMFFLPALTSSKPKAGKKSQKGLLFFVAAAAIILAFIYGESGPAAYLGTLTLTLVLFAFLVVTRIADSLSRKNQISSLVETNYVLVMMLAVSSLPLQKVMGSVRGMVGL